jgi:hypothetical protein
MAVDIIIVNLQEWQKVPCLNKWVVINTGNLTGKMTSCPVMHC